MIQKIKEYVNFYRNITPSVQKNLADSENKVISVFASARGGSTWLAQSLNRIPDSSMVWEPLFRYNKYKINIANPFAYPERYEADIAWNQYIPEGSEWDNAKAFFDKLFKREIVNLKLYRFNDLSQIYKSKLFIYKFCFGNNLLPWLVENFEISPILLVRHPCAVVASQLNYDAFNWHKNNFKYDYNMRMFADDFYSPYRDILDEISCVEERLAAEWALTVLTPIKSAYNDRKWVTLSYENLLVDPVKAYNKVFNRYNIITPINFYDEIQKTSFTKSSFSVKEYSSRLGGWQNNLSTKQIDTILSFVQRLGVDFYSDHLEPDYNKIYHEI